MPLTTDIRWVELVKNTKADNPGWGVGRIAQKVRAEGERRGLSDPPHERTIGRILRREWDPLSEEQQAQYRAFYWPESMECGDIPWEASVHCMELLGYLFHSSRRAEEYVRPTIRQAKWFWRVSMAVPDQELSEREAVARLFAIWEAVGGRTKEVTRSLEGFLTFAPWRSPENMQEYAKAIDEKVIPALSLSEDFSWIPSEKLSLANEEFGVAMRDLLAPAAKFATAVGEAAARLRAEEQRNLVSKEGTNG